MQVMMFVADAANATANGKLNVLGIFGQIGATTFPCRHTSMVLVIKITLDIGEPINKRPFAIQLLDEDGKLHLVDIAGEIEFKRTKEGLPPEVNMMINLDNLEFPEPGTYAFKLLMNDVIQQTVPIQVIQLQVQR